MKKYLQNQYVEIFYKLPPEIKDVVASSKTTDILVEIGKNHNLHLDAIGHMSDIVMDVIMGIAPVKNMVNEIAEVCHISRIDASIIGRDIDDQLLRPIKEIMRRLYEDGAPFKPDSMNTIDEKDEDHSHLDKQDILRDIENPVASEVKVVENKEQLRAESLPAKNFQEKISAGEGLKGEKQKITNNPSFVPSTSKVVEEYHTEVESGKLIIESKTETQQEKMPRPPVAAPNPIEETKKRLLDNIASMKLGGVVTMPVQREKVNNEQLTINNKTEEGVPKAELSAPETSLLRDTQKLPEKKVPVTTPSTGSTSSPQAKPSAVDPYREPAE